jgi:REP element-mobilizing transposase RayT
MQKHEQFGVRLDKFNNSFIIAFMPRKPRIFYPGAVYHVILRGNAGQDIFFDDKDRRYFYRLLGEAQEKFGHRIHAFCLMPNHIHLASQMADVSLSRVMQNLSQRYTGWINFRQSRRGHVFQGRYKALLIDADSYLLELIRYLHLNPVRAGITESVEDYPWSSYRAYLGAEKLPWLTTDWVLAQFSSRQRTARNKFEAFIREGYGEGRREEFYRGTKEGRVLGDDRFFEEVVSLKGEKVRPQVTLERVLERVCQSYRIGMESLISAGRQHHPSEVRAMMSWIVRETKHLSLTELSKRLNRDISSLSVAARRLVEKSRSNPRLAKKMEKLRTTL